MDHIEEETFEGLTPKELATSALIGAGLLVGAIVAVKLVKRVIRMKKADDELWLAEPVIEPATEN